ncbi:hypothetical protein DOTSEDRAFT_161080 [Dothistroma septosporum NZE10]|uniref:Zn(2)-C6 fungal-type domain-containing protein n=1 Tax=Dothistroma septosporum (strain NZE10 / CBS 128990) TaxID=675120 RepID=N1PDG9_DOTSN|nr:hypothetical protein DOTSEDRAFT_161080 [Dothistroma septosporum NZE10]
MDGQYPPPMPPMGVFYPTGYPPMMPPEALQPGLRQLQTLSMESLGSYSDYEDPNRAMLPPSQQSSRSRRRQPQGAEHVKHRRTRSGCYTCRQRRVKCDEAHPVCERCRKGKRECTYPGSAASSTGPPRSGNRSNNSPGGSTSTDSDEDSDEKIPLSAIPDEDEDDVDDEPQSAALKARKPTPPTGQTPSISPSTEATTRPASSRPQAARTTSKQSLGPEISQSARWSSLPKDVKYYIKYHREHMSHHHYAFKYDGGDFLSTTFLEIAMNDGSAALLYSIVAFSAYHHSIARNDDKISMFLSYYNKAIAYLQQSLKNKRHNVATLLTILQLATIEEFLGDWVNLLGHQKAALQILTDLFTPQTIMQDETRRKIINWYIRFDLFAGMMSGGETALGREWFAAAADFYTRQTRDRPQDLGARFEEYFATSRLLATDVTLLFAAKTQNNISDEQFMSSIQQLSVSFADFGSTIETAFTDSSCFVKRFPRAPAAQQDNMFNYRDPNFLYAGELSTMNFVLLDHWAIELMFKYQVTLATGQALSPDLTELALKKCKMFEAIQYGEESGPAAVLGCQASLGILALFLPKDQPHIMWCRRKFVDIEQLGYIYPSTYRQRMSDLWNTDVNGWWLPNDEGYLASIRTIRDFVQYRATKPTDAFSTGIRDMNGIFRTLNIEEQGIANGPGTADTESSLSPWRHESSPEQPWAG